MVEIGGAGLNQTKLFPCEVTNTQKLLNNSLFFQLWTKLTMFFNFSVYAFIVWEFSANDAARLSAQ